MMPSRAAGNRIGSGGFFACADPLHHAQNSGVCSFFLRVSSPRYSGLTLPAADGSLLYNSKSRTAAESVSAAGTLGSGGFFVCRDEPMLPGDTWMM
ncbi:hypothetical protein MKY96_10510 [Paenibacillus sp. FSL R7-0302]|uniref:hypothetical protein n=1 Tax=Paenibacillus sp. FSL R7-0302 TaxID=2921681 RepID=UPI0030F9AB51